jgi:hypothetical protein
MDKEQETWALKEARRLLADDEVKIPYTLQNLDYLIALADKDTISDASPNIQESAFHVLQTLTMPRSYKEKPNEYLSKLVLAELLDKFREATLRVAMGITIPIEEIARAKLYIFGLFDKIVPLQRDISQQLPDKLLAESTVTEKVQNILKDPNSERQRIGMTSFVYLHFQRIMNFHLNDEDYKKFMKYHDLFKHIPNSVSLIKVVLEPYRFQHRPPYESIRHCC